MTNEDVEQLEELEDGKLLLFQRNEIFQARIYIGNRKYIYKSLKTILQRKIFLKKNNR